MKCYISVVCVLSAFVAVTLAAPTTLEESAVATVHNQVKRQTTDSNTEALNRVISFSNSKLQILRQLCPQLFQVIDTVIQNVTSQVFRVVGGALLRSGGLGGSGGGGGSASVGGRVSVVLPTFPPDEDDDDDDDDDEPEDVDIRSRIGGTNSSTATTTASTPNALRVNVPISTNDNEVDNDILRVSSSTISTVAVTTTTVASTTASTTTTDSTTVASTTDSTTLTSTTDAGLTTTASPTPFTSPSVVQDNNTVKRHVRIPRDIDDQETSASGGNGPNPAEDLSNVDTEDADRNKRYLPFGGDGHAAGGSGNFLFDLIRNTADRAARTVGTVYRMVAGTENLGFGITATSTSSKTVATAPASQLVAGSGTTEEHDEAGAGVGGVAEVDVAPKSADHEGIPGPITRLLVIANRGIANLIQDLILRLAQTSERIVNFKARLVTALI